MIAYVLVMTERKGVFACDLEPGIGYRCAACGTGLLGLIPHGGDFCPDCRAEVRLICVPDELPSRARKTKQPQLALF